MDEKALVRAADLLLSARHVVALTGAGISVDSGIPDFRSENGLWKRFNPMEYATIDAFVEDPEKVWAMLREMGAMIFSAKPNTGHAALAELERLGLLRAVITQNIDNLHQAAGSLHVVEYHGNTSRFVCLSCMARYNLEDYRDGRLGDPPECQQCGAIVKPDVVLFGEMIPTVARLDSEMHAQKADVMLVVGTSAEVAPASLLPEAVLARKGHLIEINLQPTILSRRQNVLSLWGNSSEILPALVERVREG